MALFTTRTSPDPNTGKDRLERVYIGPWYAWPFSPERKASLHPRLALLLGLAVAAFVACGFTDSQGSRAFYVLPFFLSLPFPLFYWTLGLVRLWRTGPRFTLVDRDEGYGRLRASATGAAVLSVLHIAGETVLLVMGRAGEAFLVELLCTAAIALVGLAAWLTRRSLLPWEPLAEPPPAQGEQPPA